MDKKQWKLEQKRIEAEQLEKMTEKEQRETIAILENLEKYGEMEEPELAELAECDTVAAENLAQRFIDRGDAQGAYPYLERALKENSRFAAEMFDMLISNNILSVPENVKLYTSLLMEQYYYKSYIKELRKRDPSVLAPMDELLFSRLLGQSLLRAFAVKKYQHIEITAQQASKRIPVVDPERVYLLSLRLESENAADYSDFCFYQYFERDAKPIEEETSKKICALLGSVLPKIAEQYGFTSSVIKTPFKEESKTYSGKKDNSESEKKRAFYAEKGNIADSDVSVSITQSAASALEGNVCPACGRQFGSDGVCPSCGNRRAQSEKPASALDGKGNLHLHIAESAADGELILLNCKQCGGPVSIRDSEGSAVCESCGASYIVNDKALGLVSGGIDRDRLNVLKPKDAAVPSMKFQIRSLYGGKLGIVMPCEFTEMNAEMKAIKYPRGNPPELVLTDERGTVNYAFTPMHGMRVTQSQLPEASNQILAAFRKIMPAAQFGEHGILEGGKVAFFECVTSAEQDIYNFMMHFLIGDTCMQGAMNCLAKDKWYWGEIFRLAAQSLKTV